MGLNVSRYRHRHRHRLPLEASILFLVLTIATEGVNLVAQGAASISGGWCGLCCWVVLIPGCWVCFSGLLGLLPVGCVDSGVIPVWVAGFVFLVCWVCCRWIVWIPVWVAGFEIGRAHV